MMVYHANMVSRFLATAGVPNIVIGTSTGSFMDKATELSIRSLSSLDFDNLAADSLLDYLLDPIFAVIDPSHMFDLGGIAGHESHNLEPLVSELLAALSQVGETSHDPITYKQLWNIADEHQSSIETYQRSGDLAATGLAKHIIPGGDHTEGDYYGTSLMFEKMVRKAQGNGVELFGKLPEDYEQTHAWHGKPMQDGKPVPEAGSPRTNMHIKIREVSNIVRSTLNRILVHLVSTGRALAFTEYKYISYLLPSYTSGEIAGFAIVAFLYNHNQDTFSLVPFDVAQANLPAGYRFGLTFGEASSYISPNRTVMLDIASRSCGAELADITAPRAEVPNAEYRRDSHEESNFWDSLADDMSQEFVEDGHADPSWAGHIALSLTLLTDGDPSGEDEMQPSVIGDTSLAHAPYLKELTL